MKATEITEKQIQKTHCSNIKERAEVIRKWLDYDEKIIYKNKAK